MRRLILPAIFAAAMIVLLVYYVGAQQRFALLSRGGEASGTVALLQGRPAAGDKALEHVRALAAVPIDQRAVNQVIVARAKASGNLDRAMRETGVLRQLGWRSTSALQNLLWRGGLLRDLPLLMDTMDALLRRQKLLGQIYPILNLMTLDPSFREVLVRRLSDRVPWRYYYFLSASDLTRAPEIEGRYFVMRSVQQRGDRLNRNDVAPLLPKLIGMDRAGQAFDLWRTQVGGATSPLTDTDFRVAGAPKPGDALPIPFEWRLGSGSGYVVDAGRDERGSFASIDWNGRGAPVFLSQLTSARSGRYRLDVTGDPPMAPVADKVGFRLLCADGAKVDFRPQAAGAGRRLLLASDGRVACSYPELQLYGMTQAGTTAASIVLRSIRLVRTGA